MTSHAFAAQSRKTPLFNTEFFVALWGAAVIIAVQAACCLAAGSPQPPATTASPIEGSGRIIETTRTLPAFHGVSVDIPCDIQLTAGVKPLIMIWADDNLLPVISSEVREGVLVVEATRSYLTRSSIRLRVGAPELRSFSSRSAVELEARAIAGERLSLTTSGSANVRAEGSVNRLLVSISGSGEMDLKQLRAVDAEVLIDGFGEVELYAGRSLKARIEGSGDIVYFGSPSSVERVIEGAGEIVSGD